MPIDDSIIIDFWFDDEGALAAEEASKSFAAKLAEVDGLKTFPVVARQVLGILSRPEFKMSEVTEALEADPSLAAGVLRMANSAFFSRTKPVGSISQALVRLGGKTVREVVASVATMDLFPDSAGMGKRIRDHCAAVAALSQRLAAVFAPHDVDGLFLCGLMHDVGKMLLIESGEGDYSAEMLAPDGAHEEERGTLGYDHATLGAHVLDAWKLPAPLPKIIAWHHRPQKAYQDPQVRTKIAVLRVSDQLDHLMRTDRTDLDTISSYLNRKLDAAQIGIETEKLHSIWDELVEVRNDALELFAS